MLSCRQASHFSHSAPSAIWWTSIEWGHEIVLEPVSEKERQPNGHVGISGEVAIQLYGESYITTMAIGGLWHGASWMYVIWGLYNGFLLVAHKILHRIWRLPESLKGTAVVKVANITITFTLMVVGFTIFRAPSMQTVSEIYPEKSQYSCMVNPMHPMAFSNPE